MPFIKPLIATLEEFKAFYKGDYDFQAYARLLQSQWRASKGFQSGKLGNYLETAFSIKSKSNFITDKIKKLVQNEIENGKNEGKLISEPRIWNNLLSSQPLCFNLFGELHFDLNLATTFFKQLFPERIINVTAIKFEHSPGRGNQNYTCDRSAFDVFIEYQNSNNELGFIGIEVKYSENLKENKKKADAIFKKHEAQYLKIAHESNLFKDTAFDLLRKSPLQQIWRDHLLSIATKKDYQEGFFVFLFPSWNSACQTAVNVYKNQLCKPDENKNGFFPRHLETFLKMLRHICNDDWTIELSNRYLGIN